MRRRQSLLPRVLAFAFLLTPLQLHAQTRAIASATTAGSASGDKVLNLEDYGRWNRITGTELSHDGRWMTFTYSPNEGEPLLHVKELDGTHDYTSSLGGGRGGRAGGGGGRGGRGGGGGATQFSGDSHWITYFVNPPERAGGRGRGGNGGGGRGAAQNGQATPPVGHLELLDLASGVRTSIANAASWKFSADSKFLAVRLNKAQADAKFDGADLILRELASGTVRNIGNVDQFEFDDAGNLLAYTVSASERMGNGVYLLDLASGETRALNTAAADFDAPRLEPRRFQPRRAARRYREGDEAEG